MEQGADPRTKVKLFDDATERSERPKLEKASDRTTRGEMAGQNVFVKQIARRHYAA